MQRIYYDVIHEHLENHRQMIFLVGPRQVGKTTLATFAKTFSKDFYYLNFDILEDRQLIMSGANHVWNKISSNTLTNDKLVVVFDEIHKYSKWKIFLKGFFDGFGNKIKIIVTGSARLDVYSVGGDSLMGRYLPYVIYPLSIREITSNFNIEKEYTQPSPVHEKAFLDLWTFGGFPEIFLKASKSFSTRIHKLRNKQLFYEDIRSLSNIHEISQLEVVAELLKFQVGSIINRTEIAKKTNVSVSTISRWLSVLEAFYYLFTVKPFTKNISRSLIKEPKLYLWDWALLTDNGQKAENFIACHLAKAVSFWNDIGLGDYELYYLRDKEQREVDFLITKNTKPWFLVEAKYSNNQSISKNLYYYQKSTNAKHAFQVVIDMEYIDADCFKTCDPIIVPARTFLSQLI